MPSSRSATLQLILDTLEDNKAQEIVSIPLKGKLDIADYMVIASGTSNRHLASMADDLHRELKVHSILSPLEGEAASDWLVVDAGDVIVHLFMPEKRAFYNLEKLWS